MSLKKDKIVSGKQDIINCRACGSNKIKLIGNIFYYYASIFFLLSCGLIWIPIIGWVLIPVALVCGLVSLIIGIFYNKYRVKCVECDNGFSVPKEKYLSLKKLF